jgi:hypothetical protein
MIEIARGCKLLESLNLTWCVNVDDEALFAIAENCLKLNLLSVFGLKGVSDAMLDALAMPGRCSATLQTLDVHACPNVSRIYIYFFHFSVLFPFLLFHYDKSYEACFTLSFSFFFNSLVCR